MRLKSRMEPDGHSSDVSSASESTGDGVERTSEQHQVTVEPTSEVSSNSGSTGADGERTSEHHAPTEEHNTHISPFSDLPEVVPPATFQGIEVVKNENDYMEVVPGHGKEAVDIEHAEHGKESLPYDSTLEPAAAPNGQLPTIRNRLLNGRICGIRARWLVLAAAALLVLILVLGIGLGVGLHTSNSRSGALRGTKISVVAQPFVSGGSTEQGLVMYFQHRTGQIRWMGLGSNGKWVGGDASTLVAADAKLGTPISAVSYTWDGSTFWRVYYVDTTNTLQEIWSQNTREGQWYTGPLSGFNYSPFNADDAGMTAYFYGPKYGSDQDFEGAATTANAKDVRVRLAYARDESTFEILHYVANTQKWTKDQSISGLSGHTTPACYNDYMMFVDEENAVNVYWKGESSSGANDTMWRNTSVSIPSISSSAVLAYSGAFYAQDANSQKIKGYNVAFGQKDSKLSSDFEINAEPGIPGTGVGLAVHVGDSGDDEVLLFYQTSKDQITMLSRGFYASGGVSWSSSDIRIPYN